jgi:hypothetical protein
MSRTSSHGCYSYVTAAAQPAGVFVTDDGSEKPGCKVPASAANVAQAIGVVQYKATELPPADTTVNDYAADTVVPVQNDGDIWVVCEEAMALTDDVYVRWVTGTGTQLGAVRNDADTSGTDRAALLPNARVVKASTGAGVVLLRINLPAAAS